MPCARGRRPLDDVGERDVEKERRPRMSFHPLRYITENYAGSSLLLRKKSLILARVAIGFGIVSLAFAALMAATKASLVAVVFVVLAAFCAIVLATLRAGKYHVASSAFLYGVFVAMFVAIKFDAYADVYETYVFGTLGCFLLIVATLIADRPSQAIAIGVLDLIAVELLYWLDAFPKDGRVVTLLAIQSLSVSSLMIALGAAVAAYQVRLASGLLREVESDAQAAERGYGELNQAMARAQAASQRIGEELSASVSRTALAIDTLRERVSTIVRGMDELDGALGRSGEANRASEIGQGDVKKTLAAYSEQVSRASAAIEEMAAAAGSLASQATSKREAVRGLSERSKQGEASLASMSESIARMRASAGHVVELSSIIGDVADRTNLLGMNASIEAAHAGQAGRGFAVVADQIRGLSVETSKSARVISDTLKESQAVIETASTTNEAALGSFRAITEEIRGVSLMIDELLASIQELSAGSADVLSAVQAVADLTRSTEEAVAHSGEASGRLSEGIGAVAQIASRVRRETAEMSSHFDAIRGDAEEVQRLGGENLDTLRTLKAGLDGYARTGGSQAERGISVKSGARPVRAI